METVLKDLPALSCSLISEDSFPGGPMDLAPWTARSVLFQNLGSWTSSLPVPCPSGLQTPAVCKSYGPGFHESCHHWLAHLGWWLIGPVLHPLWSGLCVLRSYPPCSPGVSSWNSLLCTFSVDFGVIEGLQQDKSLWVQCLLEQEGFLNGLPWIKQQVLLISCFVSFAIMPPACLWLFFRDSFSHSIPFLLSRVTFPKTPS